MIEYLRLTQYLVMYYTSERKPIFVLLKGICTNQQKMGHILIFEKHQYI
jgi:hypothetical protein